MIEILFWTWLIFSGVYVVFNFKTFALTWWGWIKSISLNIFKGFKYIVEVIKKWIGKK